MPRGMGKGSVKVAPTAWVIDENHQCDGGTTKHVE